MILTGKYAVEKLVNWFTEMETILDISFEGDRFDLID